MFLRANTSDSDEERSAHAWVRRPDSLTRLVTAGYSIDLPNPLSSRRTLNPTPQTFSVTAGHKRGHCVWRAHGFPFRPGVGFNPRALRGPRRKQVKANQRRRRLGVIMLRLGCKLVNFFFNLLIVEFRLRSCKKQVLPTMCSIFISKIDAPCLV